MTKNKIEKWVDTHAVDWEDLPIDLTSSPDEELNTIDYIDSLRRAIEQADDKTEMQELMNKYIDEWIEAADEWFELEYKYADDTQLEPDVRLAYHFIRDFLNDETEDETENKDIVYECTPAEMQELCDHYGFPYSELDTKTTNKLDEELPDYTITLTYNRDDKVWDIAFRLKENVEN